MAALVIAVDGLGDLHEDVVGQGAGAEAEEIGGEPNEEAVFRVRRARNEECGSCDSLGPDGK